MCIRNFHTTGVLFGQTTARGTAASAPSVPFRVVIVAFHYRVVRIVDARTDDRRATPGCGLVRSPRLCGDQGFREMPGQVVECDGLSVVDAQGANVLGGGIRFDTGNIRCTGGIEAIILLVSCMPGEAGARTIDRRREFRNCRCCPSHACPWPGSWERGCLP